MFRKRVIAVIAAVFLFSSVVMPGPVQQAEASKRLLQGSGYEQGAYASTGIPVWDNWSKQSSYLGPVDKPVKQWEYELIGVQDNNMTVGPDGSCYVTSWDRDNSTGYLYSIATNGALNWRKDYSGGWAPFVPAIGSDGMLYVGSYYERGSIYPGETPPAMCGKLQKLNPSDGSEMWGYEVAGYIQQQPVMDKNGTLYFLTHNSPTGAWNADDIYAVNADGSKKWSALLSGSNYGYLVIGANGYLYTVTGNNTIANPYKLCAIDKTDGTLKASFIPTDGGSLYYYIVLGNDGTVYVTAASGYNIYALNPTTLTVKKSGDAYSFGYVKAVDSAGNIWSDGGQSKDANCITRSQTLGFNINMLASNGYFGYYDSWSVQELRGKYPDLTDAWTISASELGNASPYLAVVPRDGWIYTLQRYISTSKVVAYHGATTAGPEVASVSIAASPDDNAAAGSTVQLTAKANGGTNVQYKFTSSKMDSTGTYGAETVLHDYSSSGDYDWKSVEGLYKLYAYAKSSGGSDERKSVEKYYYVQPGGNPSNITATLTGKPLSVKVKKSVTLKVKVTGTKKPQVEYLIRSPQDTDFTVLKAFSSKTSYKWKAAASGQYIFKSIVRPASGNDVESNEVTVTVQ